MYDELDRKLIEQLSKDGRSSYADLADNLEVPQSTIRKRVKRLLETGTISIVAIPNLSQLGYRFISIIGLDVRTEDHFSVAAKLAKDPHVCFLAIVTGRFDLIAFIAVRTREEYAEFWQNIVVTTPGILRTEGFVCLKVIKGSEGMLETTQLIINPSIQP